ncbi:hypothetical protein VNI00_016522, partial [Paramarasmius palmivorus]
TSSVHRGFIPQYEPIVNIPRNTESLVPDSRSPKLAEFHANRSREWTLLVAIRSLKDVAGHIPEFSCDKYGSRLIQDRLTIASNIQRQLVFDELVPHAALRLMFDFYGNYVIQKLFELYSPTRKSKLATLMEGHLLSLSTQIHGSRVVQKAIENILPDQRLRFYAELHLHVEVCMRNPYGNFVIEKFLAYVPPQELEFLKTIQISAFQLAKDRFGCRVVLKCLELIPREAIDPLFDVIHQKTMALMLDKYGNYIIQFLLRSGSPQDKSKLITKIEGNVVELSCHKYSSNVMETLLVSTDSATRSNLIRELLVSAHSTDQSPVYLLAGHRYGNYVLQRAMEVADIDQRTLLEERVERDLLLGSSHLYITDKRLFIVQRLLEDNDRLLKKR